MTSRALFRPLPFLSDRTRAEGPAIIAPVLAPTAAEAMEQARTAAHHPAVDVLEWRIDSLVDANGAGEDDGWSDALSRAHAEIAALGVPVLVTVRSQAEGGHCPVALYARTVEAAIALRPAAVDVEMGRAEADSLLAEARAAGIATVVSAHAWEATPSGPQLDNAFAVMAAAGADVLKIAAMPQSVEDVLTLLGATARAAAAHPVPVIGIAMGELGRVTRLCGGEFGSAATFATVGEGSAPGQMTAEQVAVVRSSLLRS